MYMGGRWFTRAAATASDWRRDEQVRLREEYVDAIDDEADDPETVDIPAVPCGCAGSQLSNSGPSQP